MPSIDVAACKIYCRDLSLFLVCVYIPPAVNSNSFEMFLDVLVTFLLDKSNVFIVGDFNVPHFNADGGDAQARLMRNYIEYTGFKQLNTIPNSMGRLLDLVISDLSCHVTSIEHPFVKVDHLHPPLCIDVLTRLEVPSNFLGNADDKRYNFKKANFMNLYESLSSANWSCLYSFNDVNLACSKFYAILYEILDANVPLFRKTKCHYPSWYGPEIRRNIRLKNKYHNRYKQHGRDSDLEAFRDLRRTVKRQISSAFRCYIEAAEQSLSTNPATFWSFIRTKRRQTRIPGMLRHGARTYDQPVDIVNGFGSYFQSVYVPNTTAAQFVYQCTENDNGRHIHLDGIEDLVILTSLGNLGDKMTSGHDRIPSFIVRDCKHVFVTPLSILFNLSLKTHTFPEVWKLAKICPVLKGGDASVMTNYRAISILCNFAKVFEMSVYTCIYPLLQDSISLHQHGFVKSRSTATNLVTFTQYTSEVIDARGQVDVVYTDFSKAFDKINHQVCLNKLRSHGLSDSLLSFFKSYLTSRQQFVSYNGFNSDAFFSTSGVPQGSNLGPLLFLLYINDLAEALQCEKLLFADDLKLFAKIDTYEDCQMLQSQIGLVENWCVINCLEMNVSKCKVMSFTRRLTPIHCDYVFDKVLLPRPESVKDLGICFDSKLTFSNHIHSIAASASKMLGFVSRSTASFRSPCALKSLYYSFVRSRLEYCSVVWSPYYSCYGDELEKIQRRFAKLLSFRLEGSYPERGCDHRELLSRHGLLPLTVRRQMSSIKFLFHLIHGNIDSPGLLRQISPAISRHERRHHTVFYCPKARSNLMLKSPLYVMMQNTNAVATECDLYTDSYLHVRRVVSAHFLSSYYSV